MRKERINAAVSRMTLNNGQLEWLPKNPRQWTAEDVERTRRSIVEDQDFLEDRPPLVVEHNGKYVAFAGNLRLTALRKTAIKSCPAILYTPETDEDFATVKRRAMKDNGSFGSWDFDELANSWDDLPLADWGIPAWDADKTRMSLMTEGREGAEGYDEFVDKFQPKLTTDDCYTPQPVYDAILNWACDNLQGVDKKRIVRPFFPGGDYTDLKQYPDGCFVLDNPPFSILAEIVRFYCSNGVRFLLFAPHLSLFIARNCDVTYIVTNQTIEYENGAKVNTGFITNAVEDFRIWLCPELGEAVEKAQESEDKTKQGFVYPDNIVTAPILGKIVKRGISLKIRKESCEAISSLESEREQGRTHFGGAFIMSDGAAAERAAAERAAAERAVIDRIEAERAEKERREKIRAAATRLNLSPREKAIISRLNEADKEYYQNAEKSTQN